MIHKGDLKLGSGYSFSRRDQLRSGTTNLSDPLNQRSESHIASFWAQFGLSNSLSVTGSIPLIFSYVADADRSQNTSGLGDFSLTASVFAAPRLFGRPANLSASAGATFPVGKGIDNIETEQRNFASGTVDPVFSVVASISPAENLALVGAFYTRQVVSNNAVDRHGDLYNMRLGVVRPFPAQGLELSARIRYTNSGRNIRNGAPFPNSGGKWLSFQPGASLRIIGEGESSTSVWTELDIPLAQDVNGFQLVEDVGLRLGFRTGLTLFGHSEPTGAAEGFHKH